MNTNKPDTLSRLIKNYKFWEKDYWEIENEIQMWISLCLILIIGIIFSLFIYFKVKNKKENEVSSGFLLLTEIILFQIQKMVVQILGKKYKKVSSYILFLLFYMNLANVLSVIGFASPLTSISSVLTLGFIMLIGCFIFGILFKKTKFFLILLNPLDLMSLVTSFISISFRFFGNLVAGTIILMLVYNSINSISPPDIYSSSYANYSPIFLIWVSPLHLYFDFFSGVLHSFIFAILTLTYWSLQKPEIKTK